MSVQALTWVFDRCTTLKPAERLVLLSVANHADNTGRNSWPAISTIAREAGLGETRVKQAIKALAERGVLRIEPNAGGSADHRGDRRPNRYTIIPFAQGVDFPVDNPVDGAPVGGQTGDPRRVTGVTSGGHGGQTGDREPSLEQPLSRSDSESQPKYAPADHVHDALAARRREHERNAARMAEPRDVLPREEQADLARQAKQALAERRKGR